jgi:hypothetical protein
MVVGLVCASMACKGARRPQAVPPTALPPTGAPIVQPTDVSADVRPTQAMTVPPLVEPVGTPVIASTTTLEAAIPTPTPDVKQPPEEDPLGDKVEAMLDELFKMIQEADPLDDLPNGQEALTGR